MGCGSSSRAQADPAGQEGDPAGSTTLGGRPSENSAAMTVETVSSLSSSGGSSLLGHSITIDARSTPPRPGGEVAKALPPPAVAAAAAATAPALEAPVARQGPRAGQWKKGQLLAKGAHGAVRHSAAALPPCLPP